MHTVALSRVRGGERREGIEEVERSEERGRLRWEKLRKDEEVEEEGGEEGTLASHGMPADHERCRYDEFTFYSLPTGRFNPTASSASARYASSSHAAIPLARRVS